MVDSFISSNSCEGIGIINSSAVCDYGACCSNSYPGRGQYWYNILQYKSPADTLPKSGAPLALGSTGFTTGGDPTFVGNAGEQGAYWDMDLSFLTFTGQSSSSFTAPIGGFAANWHKTGANKQAATVVMTLQYHAIGSIQSLFTTSTFGGGLGISGYISATGKASLTQVGDTGSITVASSTTLTDSTPYVIGIGWNGASIERIWSGSSTSQLGATTFNTCAGSASSPLIFGVQFDSTFTNPQRALQLGTRFYDIQFYNKLLSNAEMASIITALESRNNIDFTP